LGLFSSVEFVVRIGDCVVPFCDLPLVFFQIMLI
jgi:hypothetical protein